MEHIWLHAILTCEVSEVSAYFEDFYWTVSDVPNPGTFILL